LTGTAVAVADLLGAPVRVGDIRLGTVVDLIADSEQHRALGLAVETAGGSRSFLPWPAVDVTAEGVSVGSALVLLAPSELEYYVERGRRLGAEDPGLERLRVSPGGELAENGGLRAAGSG
jgi:hypothetical protein